MKSVFWCLFCLLFLSACFKPTYRDGEISESVKRVVEKEYKLKGIEVDRIKNTLWIYLPVEKMVDENFELRKESLEQIGNAGHVGSRVIFSSDAEIDFIVLVAYDEVGIELKMVRNVDDIKKVRVWYIAYSDFYNRMDIDMGFNPEILGKKVVLRLYEEMRKGDGIDEKELEKYFLSQAEERIVGEIPREFGTRKNVYSRRIDESKALIYMDTVSPVTRSLFLVDVEFFDILKQILIIYLSKEKEIADEGEKEYIKLPVLSGYWDLLNEGWPGEYKIYKDIENWANEVYSREVDFNLFISDQIERRLTKKFEENFEEWNIELAELNVTYLRDEILVVREVGKEGDPNYDVDVDHEISLTVANAIRNYKLDEIKVLIIGSSGWKERYDVEREGLMKLKDKKWKRIVKKKEKEEGESFSLKDVLLGMFIPTYNYREKDKNEVSEKEK